MLSVTEWEGQPRIDLRQWWPSLGNVKRPSKRGVSMPLHRYAMLRSTLPFVDNVLARVKEGAKDIDEKWHLGSNMFVTISSPYSCVNIRQWFKKDVDGDLLPGRGISLNAAQWNEFLLADARLDAIVPDLKTVTVCPLDHQNQEGYLICSECNPNGLYL